MEENQVVEPNVIEEGSHEYEMLKVSQDIQVRDGDDLININVVDNDGDEGIEDNVGEEANGAEDVIPEFNPESDIDAYSKQLDENREGFEELTSKAIESGKVTQEDIDNMMIEYEESGKLSDATLSKLEEAGYPRKFIQSYIEAQEAVATRYANEIYNYAGGKESFDKYVEYLGNTSPETLDVLQEAVESGNLKSIKGILSLARSSMVSKFGKPQQRTVTQQARQVAAPRVEAFSSQADMITAMSDPRYGVDKAYTESVALKVYYSNF